jgi:hypothetical protein
MTLGTGGDSVPDTGCLRFDGTWVRPAVDRNLLLLVEKRRPCACGALRGGIAGLRALPVAEARFR